MSPSPAPAASAPFRVVRGAPTPRGASTRKRPTSSSSSSREPTPSSSSLGPARAKAENLIVKAKGELAPFMGPNVEGALELGGVTSPSGWESVRDRLRALLGSAASLAATGSDKARAAAKRAAKYIAGAAGAAKNAVGSIAGTLYGDFKQLQERALTLAGGVLLVLGLAAAYLLFSRYGGR